MRLEFSSPLPSVSVQLFGRDRERSLLRAHLANAIEGRGSLVLVNGEAGAGKTALAAALCVDAAAANTRILIGHCYDRIENPPYGPWIEGLTRFERTNRGQTTPPALNLATASTQDALFAEVRAFFTAVTATTPLLLLFEDMHWADAASLDLLRSFARMVHTMPLLVVVTYRADELNRRHPLATTIPLLVREGRVERLHLDPLDGSAIRMFVEARYDLPPDEATLLVAYLVERTEGNALFVTELLRTLEEEGVLRREGATWHVEWLAEVPLPHLLKQIIDTRLNRLGDVTDALLAVASVIGHEVPLAVWATVTRANEDILLAAVEAAEAAHLAVAWEAGDGFRFSHALIRDVLYENVPALRRRRIHKQIGDAFAALPVPKPDVVAYHYRQAGDERAAAWLVRAGEQSEDAYALVAAAERYETALALLDAQGSDAAERGWLRLLVAALYRYRDPDRAGGLVGEAVALAAIAGDASLAARARGMHGLLLGNHGDIHGALEALSDALGAVERLPPGRGVAGRRERQIDAMVNRGSLINYLAHFGRLADARLQGERHTARFAAVAKTPAEVGAVADAYGALSVAYAYLGKPGRARWAYAACVAAHASLGNYLTVLAKLREEMSLVVLPYEADDIVGRDHAAREAERAARRVIEAGAHPDTDDPRHARLPLLILEGHWREARRLAELPDTSYLTRLAHFRSYVLGPLARSQGDTELAWQCVRRAWPDGPEVEPGRGHVSFRVPLLLLGAALALDRGDHAAARSWLDAHRRWLDFMGATLGRSEGEVLEAEWHRSAGEAEHARYHAEQALAHATTPRQPLALLAAHRIIGALAVEGGHHVEAETHLAAALALARACRAPHERALTLIVQADLLATRGDRSGGRESLDAAAALCLPLDANPSLARIAAVAARFEVGAASPPAAPAGLSAREVEVLRLMAAGLRNEQIADQLSISPRTVKAHIANIYGKTGVNNRASVTRFALAHGLT